MGFTPPSGAVLSSLRFFFSLGWSNGLRLWEVSWLIVPWFDYFQALASHEW